MAQYTSNYNLSKPEDTDTNASFMSAYRDNMDIIDKQMGNKNIAEEYDNTQTYAVDDYVIYDGDLYKCTTAVISAENFDPAKWTQTVASDEFGSGGGGSGGHTIVAPSGTEMTQRSKMQFTGNVEVSDDSTNNKTVVNMPREVVHLTKAEYDALPDTKLTDNKIYCLEDVPAQGSTLVYPICYSELEREVGCWTNGKPLYQITIDQTIGSDADYTVFASGIENAHLVSAKCEYSSGRWMSFDYISLGATSNSRTCYVEVQNGALKLHNQSNSSIHWIVTIQYTKTADVAGSGTYTPNAVPAVHYSTDEQVIGTWINGKTLCEKVITGISAYQYPSLLDLGIPISETIVKAEMQGITTLSGKDYVVSGSVFLWSISQGQNNGAVYISKGTTNYEAYFNGASTSDVNLIIQYTKTS